MRCKPIQHYRFAKVASQNEYWASKHFLKKHQLPAAQGDDEVFIIFEHQKIIGIARLVGVKTSMHIAQNKWLRGLFICPEYRHCGLATALLEFMFQHLQACKQDQDLCVFGFAETNLKPFYQQNFFALIDAVQLPVHLQQTYWQALQQGKNWIIVKRTL